VSKQCPNCRTAHPDDLEFCPFDGAALADAPSDLPQAKPRKFAGTRVGMAVPKSATQELATRRRELSNRPSDVGQAVSSAGSSLRNLLDRGALPTDLAVARLALVAETLGTDGRLEHLTPDLVRYASSDGTGNPTLQRDQKPDLMEAAAYRAPEAGAGRLEPAAQVYALGCMLFEALTGQKPFQASGLDDLRRRHASTAAPAVRQVRRDCVLPPVLEVELQRAMRKRPGDRHTHPLAFATAIRAAVRDDERSTLALGAEEAAFLKQMLAGDTGDRPPVLVAPPAPVAALPAPPPQRRSVAGPIVAGVLGVLLLVGVVVGVWLALRPPPTVVAVQVAPPAPPPPVAPTPELPPAVDAAVAVDVEEAPDVVVEDVDAGLDIRADADSSRRRPPAHHVKPTRPGTPSQPTKPKPHEPDRPDNGPVTF
jgi:serine/threonine protein kinase